MMLSVPAFLPLRTALDDQLQQDALRAASPTSYLKACSRCHANYVAWDGDGNLCQSCRTVTTDQAA
jgi:hypothetical protein